MSPQLALAGGTFSGTAGLVAGLALEAAKKRQSMTSTRQRAISRRDAAGVVMPLAVTGNSEVLKPSWLLSPDNQVAPFRGRGRELEALQTWLSDSTAPRVLVMVGSVGAGKTRLTVEFARQVFRKWTVLRVRSGKETGLVDTLGECGEPTLVVVELNGPRPGLVILLEDVLHVPGRVRVLVECRSQAWRDSVRQALSERDAELFDSAASLEISPVGGAEDLLRWLNESVLAICSTLGIAAPRPALRGPAVGTDMLRLQSQAVALAMRGGPVAATNTSGEQGPLLAEIGAYLLEQERKSWEVPVGTLQESDAELRRRTVCFLTLLGAADENDAAQVIQRVPDLSDASEERRRTLARWVHSLYAGDSPNEWIGHLEPDILAHALYGAVLSDNPGLSGLLVDPKLTAVQLTRVLRALVPGLAAFPALVPVTAAVVEASPLRAVPQAIATALYLDDPGIADRMLAEYVTAHQPGTEDLDAIAAITNDHSLRHTRAAVGEIRVQRARGTGDVLVLAVALLNLGPALDQAGHHAESLAAIEEAVRLYRVLVLGKSEDHRPDLAWAVWSLGVALGRMGRYPESLVAAEEAVKLYRALDQGTLEDHRPHEALALQSLGLALGRMGRYPESLVAAEDAIELYRVLDQDSPADHRADLALAFGSLGAAMHQLGRYTESLAAVEEATKLYRALYDENPSVYRNELALALQNLGAALDRVGRYPEFLVAAEEAVELYRALDRDTPAVYRTALAWALRNLGAALDLVHRYPEFLAVTEEAVRFYRALDQENPAVHRSDLALALRSLGAALRRVGRHLESLAVTEEAVRLYRALDQENPAVHRSDLAWALQDVGASLDVLGRYPESLTITEEAVQLYRALDQEDPAVHRPNLAMTLQRLGFALERLGRLDDALTGYREGGQLLREVAQRRPEVYTAQYVDGQRRLRDLLRAMGRGTEEIHIDLGSAPDVTPGAAGAEGPAR